MQVQSKCQVDAEKVLWFRRGDCEGADAGAGAGAGAKVHTIIGQHC